MFSFLDEIDKYVKGNKIPLKKLEFSYTYLPEYINQAILNEMRKVTEHFECGTPTYELAYDKFNNLCLLVKDINGENITAFAKNRETISFDYRTINRSEVDLIKYACALKYFEDRRMKIRKVIEEKYGEFPAIDKVKCEYRLMQEFIKKYCYKNQAFYNIIMDRIDYETPLMDSVEKITSYIDYLYDNSKDKKVEVVGDKTTSGISYREPIKELVFRKEPVKIFGPARERINEVIATDLRFAVLESFPYIYRDYAYNYFNKEISYMAYMYYLGDNKYIIIMEPYSGKKYTKIVGITDDEEMTKQKFINYVKYYLELAKHKSLENDKIVRIGHTSFSQYEIKIKYAIASLSDELCSNYYKEKIRKLKER